MSIGPATIARDRFDYVSAISESWKDQMLLNIVKLRYADVPVFLDVSSVISQYGLEGIVNFSAGWNFVAPGDSQSFGGTGRYAERPTITYTPLAGEKFTKSLLTPIPPPALLFLLQSGWPVRFLFHTCLKSVNDIYNRSSAALWSRRADPEFEQLLDALERIQRAGGLALRVQRGDKQEASIVVFRSKVDAAIGKEKATVSRLLNLNPRASEFTVSYGAAAKSDTEIAMLTRSILEIMIEMGAQTEIPQQHMEEERTIYPSVSSEGKDKKSGIQFRIRSGKQKPHDAFAAINYRDHWFWVEQQDRSSKSTFTFLMILFSLVETGTVQGAPIITVPIN